MRARSSPAALRVYVITRIESTSSPRSQTARQKRSTMTVVLPVPAPAETKTTPGSSIARSCSRFGPASTTLTALRLDPCAPGKRRRRPSQQSRLGLKTTSQATSSGPPHPAHRPKVAPGRAREAALRVVPHVAFPNPRHGRPGLFLGLVDLAPDHVPLGRVGDARGLGEQVVHHRVIQHPDVGVTGRDDGRPADQLAESSRTLRVLARSGTNVARQRF